MQSLFFVGLLDSACSNDTKLLEELAFKYCDDDGVEGLTWQEVKDCEVG